MGVDRMGGGEIMGPGGTEGRMTASTERKAQRIITRIKAARVKAVIRQARKERRDRQ